MYDAFKEAKKNPDRVVSLNKKEFYDNDFIRTVLECKHESCVPTYKVCKNGQYHYHLQCVKCGACDLGCLSKEKALSLSNGKEINELNYDLRNKRNAYVNYIVEIHNRSVRYNTPMPVDSGTVVDENVVFEEKYSAYLLTDSWKAKRDKVMKRANGICEGCHDNPAEHVHHLTYKHVFDELLFELVAVCRECHERIHPHMKEA